MIHKCLHRSFESKFNKQLNELPYETIKFLMECIMKLKNI
uniref:Uncharacterized protein n=1 Tax=Anguilla anguilla TaxID=7936 RepID=A0A0E9XQ39_ANGAN